MLLKNVSLFILFIFILSCNKTVIKNRTKDKDYEKMTKIADKDLTRIHTNPIIFLDTIDSDEKEISINIKNIGENDLSPLKIKFHCSCITTPKYDSIIPKGKVQEIKIKFPIDKKGNFSYPIYIYGNFFPYFRKVYVEGYRK